MNIINIANAQTKLTKTPVKQAAPKALLAQLECSLYLGANFEKSVRLAKSLAPVLQDMSSNERRFALINSKSALIEEKILAIIMLGFPKNRQALPVLKNILEQASDSLRMAAAIAIGQMQDGSNNQLLSDIILASYKNSDSPELKKTMRKTILALMDHRSARTVKQLFSDQL